LILLFSGKTTEKPSTVSRILGKGMVDLFDRVILLGNKKTSGLVNSG